MNDHISLGDVMSSSDKSSQEPKSEVKEAIENADASQIKENLEQDKQVDAPQPLTKDQETPFIDEKSRTDI